MRYQGSEAIDLDMRETAEVGYATERRARRSLVVVEGGHLDADARQGVSAAFVARARLVVVAVVMLCALGALRVALTAGTVSLMTQNMTLSSHIQEASDLNDELHAERSLLSSSKRITTIATQNYGMVRGGEDASGEDASAAVGAACADTSADTAQDAE